MIDKRDIRLLAELDSDSGRSLSEISRQCGMSQQLAGYKIRKLTSAGVIRGFYTLVDYSRFGQSCFRTYLSVGYKGMPEFRALADSLSSNPYVTEVVECGGRWDIVLGMLAANASRFNKSLKELIAANPLIKSYDVVTNVVTHEFTRKYLSRKPSQDILIGGDRDTLQVNRTDRMVLSRMFTNPRKASSRVAVSLGMHPRTVRRSVSRMRDMGTIKGFRTIIDPSGLGRSRGRMLIKYRNVTKEREADLLRYCRQQPDILSVNKVLGSWDVEIDVEARPGGHLRSCIMGIREKFDDVIRETEYMEMFGTLKKAFITGEAISA